MKIFVISLKRTPERLQNFLSLNKKIGIIDIFEGVDGEEARSLSSSREYFAMPESFKPGELGNALSHIKLWETAVASNTTITVCEDDAILSFQFRFKASSLIKSLEVDLDYVTWGWNFDSVLIADFIPSLSPFCAVFDQNAMRKNALRYLASEVEPSLYRLLNCFGTLCYTITPRGAKRLLSAVKPLKIENVFIPGLNRNVSSRTLDVSMNKYYGQLKCFVAVPPLAVTFNDHTTSTVVRNV